MAEGEFHAESGFGGVWFAGEMSGWTPAHGVPNSVIVRTQDSQEYNESRPHASLKDMTPSEFASDSAASRTLTAT